MPLCLFTIYDLFFTWRAPLFLLIPFSLSQGSSPLLPALPRLAPGLPFITSRPSSRSRTPPPAPGPSRSRRSPPRGAPPLLVPAGAAGKAALAAHPLALPPPPSPERRAASRLLRPFGSKLSWKRERGRQERGRDWGAGARIMRQEGVRHKASGTRRTCSSSRSRSALRQRHRGPMALRAGVGSGQVWLGWTGVASGRTSANSGACGYRLH